MSIIDQTRALRHELRALAAKPDWTLLTRHDLLAGKPLATLKERAWRGVKRGLSTLGVIAPHVTQYPWQPTLKHAPFSAEANTLLIWAPGTERDALRRACEDFSARLKGDDTLAPVLVTDVADFAFYSRLGWLVEYLPELSGDDRSYRERKRAYLAWRYRDARIVPPAAAQVSDADWKALVEVN
ncbi:hypothetical protein [Burkholderia diffusa]|uniref:hypothetical protein n=1 Tax=Burkholderia diffusa TaxID=488732 RepID=UPI000AFAF013|nr:hypothetical protein [Burkholderia diffusa]